MYKQYFIDLCNVIKTFYEATKKNESDIIANDIANTVIDIIDSSLRDLVLHDKDLATCIETLIESFSFISNFTSELTVSHHNEIADSAKKHFDYITAWGTILENSLEEIQESQRRNIDE